MEWFKTLVEDNSGGASTMRVVLLLWIAMLCFNITYGTIKKQPFALSGELVGITACIVGAKAIQRFGEKSSEISIEPGNGQSTPNGVSTSGSLPLTVTVQGSVPIQGTMPLQQMQQPTPTPVVVAPVTPVAPVPDPTVPVVAPPTPVAPVVVAPVVTTPGAATIP